LAKASKNFCTVRLFTLIGLSLSAEVRGCTSLPSEGCRYTTF
jgi:hypothetical protein